MHLRPPPLVTSPVRRHAPNEALLTAAVLAALSAPALTQRQFDELPKRGLPMVEQKTWDAALGDVDGDGDLDIVFGDSFQNRLYLNDGRGQYVDVSERLPTSGSSAVALGDVDGDGDLDLVAGSSGQNRLLLNNGSGSFTEVTATRMPNIMAFTEALALGDVDGDGDLDILCGNYRTQARTGEQNRLYLNDGNGTFTDATAMRMPVDRDPTLAVALGDVDGDGDLDAIFGNMFASPQNRLYLNDGTGTYTDATAQLLPIDNDHTEALALGDVDGDGDLDLVVGNGPILSSGQDRLYLNIGSGRFLDVTAARMPADSSNTNAVAMGDVDRDGDLDLIFGNDGEQNALYLNDGNGTYTDATTGGMPGDLDDTRAVVLGDVDGDGDLDVVIGNGDTSVQLNRLYLNEGPGRYRDTSAVRLPIDEDKTTAVALGDVDGDGDLDMIASATTLYFLSPGGQNRLYLNDGNGTYSDATAGQMPPIADETNAAALGDVDGDGDLDLVVGNEGLNRLLLNDGSGAYSDATAARMPASQEETFAVALGDVDGDGDLDLVFGNCCLPGSEQNRLYLNDGSGRYTDATAQLLPTLRDSTKSVALGDVDADGDLDLVVGNDLQPNRLYLNNGSGRYTDATPELWLTLNDSSRSVALGDVDADGDLDLVVGNYSQQSRLYLNNGRGGFTDVTTARMPDDNDPTAAVALGDVDADGDLDLLVGNRSGTSGVPNRLYLNDGSGTFTDATSARMPAVTHPALAVAFGDVDADGDLDLVVGNDRHQNSLYLNLLRQLDAPLLLHVDHTYALEVYARYGAASPGGYALPLLATATANVPLPPFGTLFLDPSTMVALPRMNIPQPAGVASTSFVVPNVPNIVGLPLYGQALVVQLPTLARFTNLTADVILR